MDARPTADPVRAPVTPYIGRVAPLARAPNVPPFGPEVSPSRARPARLRPPFIPDGVADPEGEALAEPLAIRRPLNLEKLLSASPH